jgi:hypothetical protein
MAGSPSSAIATDKRRFMPPEYAPVRTCAASIRFTYSQTKLSGTNTSAELLEASLLTVRMQACMQATVCGTFMLTALTHHYV